ncbi:MAG: ABC transporter ATP-binding protein [Bryobacteraceae bacterium]
MITVRELTKTFGALTAVDALSFDVAEGEVFGIVGPDGAGKTTTLRMLAGVASITSGSATVAGHDVARETQAVKDSIGYMAQRFGLYADLTVAENMRFYADLFGISPAERDRLAPRLLAMTRMDPFLSRPAGKLSGGMKQKLALMCTLLHHPRVLLLDEPTNGVDPVSRRDFWAILRELVNDGLTLLLTTAYMDEAERCDRVALMSAGRFIRSAPPAELRRSLTEPCYVVETANLQEDRHRLAALPGITAVRPAGSVLHVFTRPGVAPEPAWRAITPSLEDVFVATLEARP